MAQELRTKHEVLDSVFVEVSRVVINDILKQEFRILNDSVSYSDSLQVHNFALKLIFNSEHSTLLYCSDNTVETTTKLSPRKKNKFMQTHIQLLLDFDKFIEQNRTLPYRMFEYLEYNCYLSYRETNIYAKYTLQCDHNSMIIISKNVIKN